MNDSTQAVATVTSLPTEDEDLALAARLARGETEALARLVERYQQRLAGLATRLLAYGDGVEDVVQEVFLSLWRGRHRFRGDARLWTYLATITVNRCRSQQRRRWLEERVRRLIAPGREQSTAASSYAAEGDERAATVRAAIGRLSTTYREVIVLRYLEELPISEVAEVLGIKRNAADARLSRARKMLETLLAEFSE